MPKLRLNNFTLSLLVFAVLFTVYSHSRVVNFTDCRWTIHIAMSMLKEGNANLDEYASLIPQDDYRVRKQGSHYASVYPLGMPVLVAPLVYGTDQFFRYFYNFDLGGHLLQNSPHSDQLVIKLDKFFASFFTALAGVFIFLIARLYLNIPSSLFLTFIFAFCTSAWSIASRSLWQHGPSMLLLSAALCVILGAKNACRRLWAMPILVAACMIRPTNFLSLFLISAYLAFSFSQGYKRLLWLALLWGISIFSFYIALKFSTVYLGVTTEVYSLFLKSRLINKTLLPGLMGNLFSPSRGLFILSPVLLFSVRGFFLKRKYKEAILLDYLLAGVILAHWLIISVTPRCWDKGWSFGPRYFSCLTPYFIYFLIPVIKRLRHFSGFNGKLFLGLFIISIAISFVAHYRGANVPATWLWNAHPVNIDFAPSRCWDWRDIQFLR